MGKGLGERSGEVGVTEGGLGGEERCDKETERERDEPFEKRSLSRNANPSKV